MFEGLFQPTHLLIIMVIALIVFGPGRLGDVGGELGRAVRDLKKSMGDVDEIKDAFKVDVSEPARKPADAGVERKA